MEYEPDFPEKDISDETAAILELLLLNRELVDSSHNSAEIANLLFRLGHSAIDKTASARINATRLSAFSYGVTAFEAVSTLVNPVSEIPTEQDVALRILAVSSGLDKAFTGTVADARDRFVSELPRTKLVIGQSAARFYFGHDDYAVGGAAMARELALQTAS